ncbi:hypothetical protein [Salinivibrio proteolyticus]|uniref:hypothetical protein n=1 Tax=Salinivibrio proteolyticus TaxID=334715 RepID=UPI0010548E71|nr:hypothetical protein [Salinivibrio proteolyticus]
MNVKIFSVAFLVFFLTACSSTTSKPIDRDLFVGTWHCASPTHADDLNFDGKTTYWTDGLLDGTAIFDGQMPDVDGRFLFEVNIQGTWELKHNKVYEYIESVSVEPLNELSKSFKPMFTKAIESNDESVSTVLSVDSEYLFWHSQGNASVDRCERVLN